MTDTRAVHVEDVMGMAVSFDLRAPLPGAGALEHAVQWLHHVDATFSTYRPASQISRLGRGEIALGDVDDDVRYVLRRCLDLGVITGGAFDAFGLTERHGSTLDPSGFVKGWAIERVANILEGAGADTFCINAGGDIVVRGAPGTRPWRVAIRHPFQPDHLAAILEVCGPHAVATSATYERGTHIIDPASGLPTDGLASATVIGPDLGAADAYATAVFVMGHRGLDWIEDQPGYDAFVITHEVRSHRSSTFETSVAALLGRAVEAEHLQVVGVADPAAHQLRAVDAGVVGRRRGSGAAGLRAAVTEEGEAEPRGEDGDEDQ